MLRLTSGTYCDDHAREYAVNGLARRIQTISRCIMQVYKILPPDQSEIPEIDTVYDAMIYIQAAIFNTYGALDNLAFIWGLGTEGFRQKRTTAAKYANRLGQRQG